MDKTSKIGQLRAMREARAEQPKLHSREDQRLIPIEMVASPKVPTPDLKPASPAPNVATKRKKRTAEVIGKSRQASREGKRSITIYAPKDLVVRIKVIAAQQETTIEEWVTTALEMRLGIK